MQHVCLVHDLIDEANRTWKSELLRQIFHAEDATAVLAIPLSLFPMSDQLRWGGTRNGGLATGVNLVKRNVQVDPICARCGKDRETVDHILLDCDFARATCWGRSIKRSLKVLQLPYTNWQLWIARNELIFNGTVSSPMEVNRKAEVQFGAFEQAQRKSKTPSGGPANSLSSNRIVSWAPPTMGTTLLNTDAAFKDGKRGLGYVLRSYIGLPLTTTSELAHFSSVLQGECLAIRSGLLQCIAECLECLMVESDSLEAIKLITTKETPPDIQPIISNIKFLITH
ncbi:uncharacterized protein LOC122650798 [Telopea speciosissima]|uniref:uncharacterized protein LOC122650798 n=1 Tax=Telopea speciosissima TaxID=54955 RepID=UPI001CC6C79E|nr:uncharacterized protein LOC122650798 [Telopea speciosissima]